MRSAGRAIYSPRPDDGTRRGVIVQISTSDDNDLRSETRCPHGLVVDWGDHGPDPRDGSVGAEVCIPCSPPVLELRVALQRIRDMTGDARVRRIADEALERF
jgi:hypothetical protein